MLKGSISEFVSPVFFHNQIKYRDPTVSLFMHLRLPDQYNDLSISRRVRNVEGAEMEFF